MAQIKISDDQNTVELYGEKYIYEENNNCFNCDLQKEGKCIPYILHGIAIPCLPHERKDKKNVIFKLKK